MGMVADRRQCASRSARCLTLLAIGMYFFFGLPLCAQTSDATTSDANKSWTETTDSQSDNLNPTRIVESHTDSGNRTLDNQSVQRRGSGGQFEPYQDIEKETVKLDANTVKTITRTYGRDSDGAKTLLQVTEEEKHDLPGGGSNVVRSTSNPDANGDLQLVQRRIEETKKISKDVEETKTTVMLPSINGGIAPAMQVEERRERGANDTVQSQKTTLLPDGAGHWQIGEVQHSTTKQDGKNRITEDQVSRPDSEGNMGAVSRTVSKASESVSGEKRDTVETYSVDAPGLARDGALHLVERATTVQHSSPTGLQTTKKQVEQPTPGELGSGLQVTTLTVDTVQHDSSGTKVTQTIETLGANGSLGIVSVDTSKSDKVQAIQIAPSEKPK
jgi:hypothetical protein